MILILLVVFGSLAAASLQVALAAVSVVITGAAIFFISQVTDMSVFSISVASLVGIGVAVDYALFILARYREERKAGADADDARRTALATSGKAVLFSGTVVAVSLASLWLTDSTLFRSIALGAVIVVVVSVLAALMLLPAMIAMLGDRLVQDGAAAARRAAPSGRGGRAAMTRQPFWNRWVDRVVKRPLTVVIAVSAIMLALAAPVLFIKVGDPAITQFPDDHELRKGTALAGERDRPRRHRADPAGRELRARHGRRAGQPPRAGAAGRRAARRPACVAGSAAAAVGHAGRC